MGILSKPLFIRHLSTSIPPRLPFHFIVYIYLNDAFEMQSTVMVFDGIFSKMEIKLKCSIYLVFVLVIILTDN